MKLVHKRFGLGDKFDVSLQGEILCVIFESSIIGRNPVLLILAYIQCYVDVFQIGDLVFVIDLGGFCMQFPIGTPIVLMHDLEVFYDNIHTLFRHSHFNFETRFLLAYIKIVPSD